MMKSHQPGATPQPVPRDTRRDGRAAASTLKEESQALEACVLELQLQVEQQQHTIRHFRRAQDANALVLSEVESLIRVKGELIVQKVSLEQENQLLWVERVLMAEQLGLDPGDCGLCQALVAQVQAAQQGEESALHLSVISQQLAQMSEQQQELQLEHQRQLDMLRGRLPLRRSASARHSYRMGRIPTTSYLKSMVAAWRDNGWNAPSLSLDAQWHPQQQPYQPETPQPQNTHNPAFEFGTAGNHHARLEACQGLVRHLNLDGLSPTGSGSDCGEKGRSAISPRSLFRHRIAVHDSGPDILAPCHGSPAVRGRSAVVQGSAGGPDAQGPAAAAQLPAAVIPGFSALGSSQIGRPLSFQYNASIDLLRSQSPVPLDTSRLCPFTSLRANSPRRSRANSPSPFDPARHNAHAAGDAGSRHSSRASSPVAHVLARLSPFTLDSKSPRRPRAHNSTAALLEMSRNLSSQLQLRTSPTRVAAACLPLTACPQAHHSYSCVAAAAAPSSLLQDNSDAPVASLSIPEPLQQTPDLTTCANGGKGHGPMQHSPIAVGCGAPCSPMQPHAAACSPMQPHATACEWQPARVPPLRLGVVPGA